VLNVLDAEEIDEAYKKVQEKVEATTPKADVPFGVYKGKSFDFAEEPTSYSTAPVTKTTDGDYNTVLQTNNTV
jgi:hypothetical protein